jgi:MinD-like ATPase involved in chromosome partitioning or flagellar assembly
MTRIVSIHSFRGGTGKSNITANLAALAAAAGKRVGVVDTDIQSPGIHVLFGLHGDDMVHTLNHYLWGQCEIQQAALDVSERLGTTVSGSVFLIPSSMKSGEIARVLREGCDPRLLTSGLRRLAKALDLDLLLIDTHPGLNEETLLSIALSHTLLIIMRPDQQDYEGTGVTAEVAAALDVPRTLLVVNKVPPMFDAADVRMRVAQTYGCEVGAVLAHSDDVMALASGGIFALLQPQHVLSVALHELAVLLVN